MYIHIYIYIHRVMSPVCIVVMCIYTYRIVMYQDHTLNIHMTHYELSFWFLTATGE